MRHRADLNHLLDILGGETAIGHSFTFGGDDPDVETVPVGLLGADLEVADGRYRIARIYRGESWNPELRAPLSGPGIDAAEGDYLLAVDGVELTAADNPYSLFDRTADRQTVLTLNAQADARRRPRGDGGAGGRTTAICASASGSRPTAARWTSSPAAGWPTSGCPTPAAAATPPSTATTSPSRTSRGR